MYVPPHFEEVDEKEIIQIIEQFPLASVVCYHGGEFLVNHIPLLRIEKNLLIGHIAKANSLHDIFPNGADAVAVFNSEDSYISPNWYPTKKITHRHVPTWNYQAVHLHGHIEFDYSKKSKLSVVGKLTKVYEEMYCGENPWKISDAPTDYLEGMLDNIVSFTFEVERTVAKSKISQNREDVDYEAVEIAMKDMKKNTLANTMKRFKRY